jgi:hypothetical protein
MARTSGIAVGQAFRPDMEIVRPESLTYIKLGFFRGEGLVLFWTRLVPDL